MPHSAVMRFPAPTYVDIKPPTPLQRGVRRIVLFREFTEDGVTRHEPPRGFVTLITTFADPILLTTPNMSPRASMAFVASADTAPVTAACGANNVGVEIQMRPWFAVGLFRATTMERAGDIVDVTPHFPSGPRMPGFGLTLDPGDLADAAVNCLLRLAARMPRAPRPEIAAAWALLEASGGCLSISDLASRLGWSQRHLKAVFKAETGLKPKQAARLLRFGRACDLLEEGDVASLAEISVLCGYSDQSHMTREFKTFAAMTPAALGARRLNDLPGFAEFGQRNVPQVSFLQDAVRRTPMT